MSTRIIKLLSFVLLVSVNMLYSQNIAITDDNGYTASGSAMLDVKSVTKGMLVPRMTSVQRTSIVTPATGLLVFDTNENVFYYYTGTAWTNMSTGQLWSKNGNYVYLTNTDENVGIGVTAPDNKLLVKADATTGIDESIFAVLNNNGDTVFAVYQEGVRIWVNDAGGTKANGSRGGFAVGGFSPTKLGVTNEYLRVTPDSVRVYIDDSYIPAKANGSRGGFAVGGFNPAKGTPTDNYLFVQDDSTRVYVTGDEGFAIDNIALGSEGRYMDLTPQNYFIGHNSGQLNTTGLYNSFIGYQSGMNNSGGSKNVFLGYQSGISNTLGETNIFIGHKAGYSNIDGNGNIFIGDSTGSNNQTGWYNVFLGHEAGVSSITTSNCTFIGAGAGQSNTAWNNTFVGNSSGTFNTTGAGNTFLGLTSGCKNITGSDNIYIGYETGFNSTGSNNVFVGRKTGYSATGSGNVFLGYNAGYNETGSNKLYIESTNISFPLIYGEFDNDIVKINGDLGVRIPPNTSLSVYAGNESAILTNFTQAINSSGINIVTNYTSGTYTPGFFWSTANDNATKPKAGIWLYEDGFGSDMYFGTSNSYLTGITNTAMMIEETGDVGFGTTTPNYKVHAVDDQATNDSPAVYGMHSVTDYYGIGVQGVGRYRGVIGTATSASGASVVGIYGTASGVGTGTRYGVYGSASGGATAYAGYFAGNVHVNGTLSKNAGTFKIDHPQDPENKYLIHSFVESPDMKNVYDGVIVLDNTGKATVQLPSYFEALNKDFRYLLTTIGGYAPVFIESEIQNGQFVIAGGNPGMKVSWQITGIRKDPYAIANPVIVEQNKNKEEQGLYLNPELYNQPDSKSLNKEIKK